ncbi:hypothetical protein KR059_001159 [Drosophila kikkawai]|nr:hypothetical protein KR059_001159 [Drosophila kikkawai]
MRVSKVSIIILRGWFFYARCIGAVFWHFKLPKDHEVVTEGSWRNRSWWKWISMVWRLVPLCVNAYTYSLFIWKLANLVDQVLNGTRLVIITSCCLSLIHLQIFHGEEVIRIMNQYLRLFNRVSALFIRSEIGFGGGRELCLILLSLGCQVQEIVFFFGIFQFRINEQNLLSWSSGIYVFICCNIIMRITFIWYLSLGVLYSNLNKNLLLETQCHKRHQKLKNAMALFRDISCLVTSLQKISNKYLFLNLLQTLFSVISISYKMIADRQFYQFWIWFWFVKTVLDMLVLSLAIEGAVNKFNFIREIILDMFLLSERTEWNRKMELFITHLNLYQFRVSLMGLFDVSNKFFPVVVTSMITYLVFIVQFVMQLKIQVLRG